jgi:urea transport system permease protein
VAVVVASADRAVWTPRFWTGFAIVGLVLGGLIPVLNLAVAHDSPIGVPDYLVPLFGKYVCYAILAMSLDLVWGYAGILSLGHGAFFALGGYCMGMYLMRQIGTRGVYQNPVLPDFMVFLQYKELPWFWWGFDHFAWAAAMIVLVPGVFALVFGWLAFRSRVTGVYLSIITQAMTYALWLAFFRNDMGFGGNNGLTDYKDILGWDVHLPQTRLGLYVASVVVLGIAYLACRFITHSKLGRVLLALRGAESRVRFLGYSVTNAKLFVFTVSAVLAGIAGALYVPQVGIINPSEFSPGNSIEIAIWVSVGGRGTLVGAVLGAVLVNVAKTWLTSSMPEIWLFFLGGLFVLSTLVFPSGLVGIARPLLDWRARRAPIAAEPVAPAAGALPEEPPLAVKERA